MEQSIYLGSGIAFAALIPGREQKAGNRDPPLNFTFKSKGSRSYRFFMTMDKLNSITYINLPPFISGDLLDRRIKVPVRIPDGQKRLRESDISLNSIVSAMIEVVAWDEKHKDVDYFKRFILGAEPGIVEKLNEAAIAKKEQKDYEFAEELFLAVYHLLPQSASCINLATNYSYMAVDADEKGDEKKADECISKALGTLEDGLRRFGEDEEILSELASFEGYLGRLERAQRYLDRYFSVATEGEKKQQMKDYAKRIKIQQQDDQEIMEAYDFIKLEEPEKAIERMDSFLSRNPKVWNAFFLRGWAYRKQGNYDKGREDFLQCLKLGQSSSEIYNELCLCELGAGNRELAKTYLETAVDLDPDNMTINSNLAFLYLEDGQFDEAREYLEKARYLSPSDSIVKHLIEVYTEKTGEEVGEIIHEEIVHNDNDEYDDEILAMLNMDNEDPEEECHCGHHHEDGHCCHHHHEDGHCCHHHHEDGHCCHHEEEK